MPAPRPIRRIFLRSLFAPALTAVVLATGFVPAFSQQAAAQACPDYTQPAVRSLSYTSDQLWTPRRHAVTAGGTVNLGNCSGVPGRGYVIHRPDFAITFDAGNRNRALEFRVSAACDTVLLVNDAAGSWHFIDDADGSQNPRLRLPRARSGRYDVWVGTYGRNTCQATLTIETF